MGKKGFIICVPPRAQAVWMLLSPLLSLLILWGPGPAGAAVQAGSDSVTVYYFHSTYRCESCLFIEGIAETTLRAEFPDELSAGKVMWRPLNMRPAENSHFITKFGLEANELVVVREKGGKSLIWEKISGVWELSSNPERLSTALKDGVVRLLRH